MTSSKFNLEKFRLLAVLLVLFPFPSFADSNAALLQRIKLLEAQLKEIRREVTNQGGEPSYAKHESTKTKPKKTKAGFGKTDIRLGGFIKMDLTLSDYSDGFGATAKVGEELFVPATIPIGGPNGDVEFHTSAKNSRLYVSSATKLASGVIKTRFEVDSVASSQGNERVSNSSAMRIRQAFVSWSMNGKSTILGGHAWSTFTDLNAKPETLILLGPIGSAYVRQEQLKYTRKLDAGSIQVALENPATTLYGGAKNPFDDNSTPDFILRYNSKKSDFSYSLMAMSREFKYQDKMNNERTRGYGLSFTGKYQWQADDLRFSLIYGDGIGRYMGLNSYRAGFIDAQGEIELVELLGMTVAYRHPWNKKWRSNLVLSASRADNPPGVSAATPSAYRSYHLNLLYQPVAKLTLGGEILYASKTLENRNGSLSDDEGILERMQFSMKYVF